MALGHPWPELQLPVPLEDGLRVIGPQPFPVPVSERKGAHQTVEIPKVRRRQAK